MKVISWNVNSILKRKNLILDLLKKEQPNSLFLQQINISEVPKNFEKALEKLGYSIYISGVPSSRGGTACITNLPFKVTESEWLDHDGSFQLLTFKKFRCLNLKLPEGHIQEEGKDDYKYYFLEDIGEIISDLEKGGPLVVAGDFSLCLSEDDIHKDFSNYQPYVENRFVEKLWDYIISFNLKDSWSVSNITKKEFSFYDHKPNSWKNKIGMRPDYIFCSKHIRVVDSNILSDYRDPNLVKEIPPLHCPVDASLDIRFGNFSI